MLNGTRGLVRATSMPNDTFALSDETVGHSERRPDNKPNNDCSNDDDGNTNNNPN